MRMCVKQILSVVLTGGLLCAGLLTGCAGGKRPAVALVVADSFADQFFYDSVKAGAQKLEKYF